MGNCWARIFRRRRLRRHIVLIMIGLDNAGKTKTVNNLVGEKDDNLLPTVGFKAVNLIHKDTPVTIYDLGGGPQFRQIWSQYYSEVHGVIFVIDSSDFSRLDECKTVLEEVLSNEKISGKPVLVLANKQDKDGALDDIDVVEKLNIEPLVNRFRCPTLVESYTASIEPKNSKKPKLDPGLKKGYQWLLNYISRRYGDINLRVQTDKHADLEHRRRMLHKAATRASQTFTAVSDDIATQTGFENPNYDSLSRKPTPDSIEKRERSLEEEGVIIVKPVNKSSSLNTTVTLENIDDSETMSYGKPKLSPLFGTNSSSSGNDSKVELEARGEYRKLSPIVRNKSGANQHMDFVNRPQSSPTTDKKSTSHTHSSSQDQDTSRYGREDSLASTASHAARKSVRVEDAEFEIAVNHKDLGQPQTRSATATSDIVATSRTLPPVSPRPHSATQRLRSQLEITHHKRRLSLRYMHRNKTSPERLSMFHYEPSKQMDKPPPANLEKGDFDHHGMNYLTQKDLTL